MCGIAGLVSLQEPLDAAETRPALMRMTASLSHRGPDGAGVWISDDRRVALGHRRLAIVDLSDRASQPMLSSDGLTACVFNGEIYNHAELRSELVELGASCWRTDHSDTEVILWAYRIWGPGCLDRFRGMFAFALWDSREKTLWLVRDRIGVKPLYYAQYGGRIAFASEMKALLSDPSLDRSVDTSSLYHCFSFLAIPAPGTMFEKIRKVPAGSWLRIDAAGGVQQREYWDVLSRAEPLDGAPEAEICQRVMTELRASVRLRKVADVPVGIFLSGGLDSSTNAVLFAEGERLPVKTFSIGYIGDLQRYHNELGYAKVVADHVGTDHHEVLIDREAFRAFVPYMTRLQEEPIADPICASTYFLAKAAVDAGIKVCQVGEGADELFIGYPSWLLRYRAQRLIDSLGIPREAYGVCRRILAVAGGRSTRAYDALRRVERGIPIFAGGIDAFADSQKRQLLSPQVLRDLSGLSSSDVIESIRRQYLDRARRPSVLGWMTYVDLKLRLPEHLLMRVDKMTMAVGLEARVPFLDHKLVELMISVSDDPKLRGGEAKHLLKRGVRDLLPKEILSRKKQGFGMPLADWFGGELRPMMSDEIVSFAERSNLLNRTTLGRVLPGMSLKRIWYLYNLAVWWKEFAA